MVPGINALLDRLEAAGIAVAVASNGPTQKICISLGPSGLWDRLTGRIYSREDHEPKPGPGMLLHAMKVAGRMERGACGQGACAGLCREWRFGTRCGQCHRFHGYGAGAGVDRTGLTPLGWPYD